MFLLTYRPSGSDVMTKNSWRRILSLEEVEAVARSARAKLGDARARDFGRRGGLARWRNAPVMDSITEKKRKSSDVFHHRKSAVSVMENTPPPGDGNRTVGPISPVMETEPPIIISRGGGAAPARNHDAPTPEDRQSTRLVNVAELPWSQPRVVEITLALDEALNPAIDARPVPVHALTVLEEILHSDAGLTAPPGRAVVVWPRPIGFALSAALPDGSESPAAASGAQSGVPHLLMEKLLMSLAKRCARHRNQNPARPQNYEGNHEKTGASGSFWPQSITNRIARITY
jgi:hypothetical protein